MTFLFTALLTAVFIALSGVFVNNSDDSDYFYGPQQLLEFKNSSEKHGPNGELVLCSVASLAQEICCTPDDLFFHILINLRMGSVFRPTPREQNLTMEQQLAQICRKHVSFSELLIPIESFVDQHNYWFVFQGAAPHQKEPQPELPGLNVPWYIRERVSLFNPDPSDEEEWEEDELEWETEPESDSENPE